MENKDVTQPKVNGWLVILSILIPLVGLILFLTQKDENPKVAKVYGICAVISFLVAILIPIILGTFVSVTTVKSTNDLMNKVEIAAAKSRIENAKDTIMVNVQGAHSDYLKEKYNGNDNIDISEYISKAVKESKEELSYQEITLKASENKIVLSTGDYEVTGTINDEWIITWSEIEKK